MKFTQKKLMSKTTARVHCGWSVPQMSRLNSQIKNMMTEKCKEYFLPIFTREATIKYKILEINSLEI